MFRYKIYLEHEERQKNQFISFYKDFLALLFKYGYSGQKIGCYDMFAELNRMRHEIVNKNGDDTNATK